MGTGGARCGEKSSGCDVYHASIPYSQYANCGSLVGFVGGCPRGLFLSVQYKRLCGTIFPSRSGIYQFPWSMGGREERIGEGSPKYIRGYFDRAYDITLCHIGAAIKPATDFTIGELSLFPTHTPIAIEGL